MTLIKVFTHTSRTHYNIYMKSTKNSRKRKGFVKIKEILFC